MNLSMHNQNSVALRTICLSAFCCSGINIDSMVIHAEPDQMASQHTSITAYV